MTNFIQNVLQISITMAAVIGVLLLLVPVWQKRYSAKWRKAIWLIIAVRLLVPFSIELPSAPVQMNVDMHQAIVLSPQSVPTETTNCVCEMKHMFMETNTGNIEGKYTGWAFRFFPIR